MSNFLLWLVTVAHTLGCIGGVAFLVLAVSGWIPFGKNEYRCRKCAGRFDCPAAYTGVCYPCGHYEKEKAGD